MEMTNTSIHPELAQIALEKAEGFAFERFSQDFLSCVEGRTFIPLGGVKDGGADGMFESDKDTAFYQITIQENHRDKIRKTYERLVEFGRVPKSLYYLTSRSIPHIDKEEELLSDELDIRVRIRDVKYIISHMNDSSGTVNAFNIHLRRYTQFLETIGNSATNIQSAHVKDPSAFVFLQHEITNRLGDRKLIHSLADTMILWSLSETDPEKNILMGEPQIRKKIFQNFPWAEKILKSHIGHRLKDLRVKNTTGTGRELRWYKKTNEYCLPYETRESIKNENQHDEALRIGFVEELKLLSSEQFDADDGEYSKVAEICLKVVNQVFEKQGLLFSHFISSEEDNDAPLVVSDCIDNVISNSNISVTKIEEYRDYIESVLRKVFYQSSPAQRQYLSNLSKTYVLLFTLQAEPKIIEYFSGMSASFRLFLGSDILVKALSERYLPVEDQVARNLLRISRRAGISMYLSECVLEEVYTHISGTDYEFINNYAEIEPYINREFARNSNKILIRAYFYAKADKKINGWKNYLGQFISYENIHNNQGREELKNYLLAEYSLEFVENAELESATNEEKVNTLAQAMMDSDDKKNNNLAYNSALLVHGIYGLRRQNKETNNASEYGLKTWWMTNQSRVLKHTPDVIREHRSQYIMRPEYILNFIAMSPNCESARNSLGHIFPSNFGIQLGHRLKDDVFRKVLAQVKTWKEYEPGRITALMSQMSDKLKSDRLKRYEQNLDDDSDI